MHSHTVLTTLQIQCSHLHYYGLPDVDRSLSSSFIVELSNSTVHSTLHYTKSSSLYDWRRCRIRLLS
jgi:hypothetical protein